MRPAPYQLLILVALLLAACQTTAGDDPVTVTSENVPLVTELPLEQGQDQSEAETTAAPETATAKPPAPDAAAAEASATLVAEIEPTGEVETPSPVATNPPPQAPVSGIQLVPIVDGFVRPTYLTHAFDERLFVVEQAGLIHIVKDGQVLEQPFLDIQSGVGSEALEQGLLSVAFHPMYQDNGYFFVNYTDRSGDTMIARFQVSADDPDRADPASEFLLMSIDQPYGNHNGGQIQFGPDGYLYVGMGDGGSAGDPGNHAQNGATLLGSLLRLDVDGAEPYAIPADNPYLQDDDKRDELWAIGLRNPWRFSFDRDTGDLYIADVGQNLWEEINFTPNGTPGGQNYGWRPMEGSHCYETESCDMTGLTLPVTEYPHQDGCSVSGGYVYRGEAYDELKGNYFFGDYCMTTVWSLFRQPDGSWLTTPVLRSGLIISSFGEDAAGELYILDHQGGGVYQIRP